MGEGEDEPRRRGSRHVWCAISLRYQSRVKVVYHVSPVLPSRQFDVSMPFLRKQSTLPLAPQATVTPSQSDSRQVSKHAAIDIVPCDSEPHEAPWP